MSYLSVLSVLLHTLIGWITKDTSLTIHPAYITVLDGGSGHDGGLTFLGNNNQRLAHPPRHFTDVYGGDAEPRIQNLLQTITSQTGCSEDIDESFLTDFEGMIEPRSPFAEGRVSDDNIYALRPLVEVSAFGNLTITLMARWEIVIEDTTAFGRI